MAVKHVELGAHANTSTPGQSEFNLKSSERARKQSRKKKDGTEGLDAVDERSDADRLEDGFKLMSGNDY